MSTVKDPTKKERIEQRDSKGRRFEEYSGKRFTTIETHNALARTKSNGELSKAQSLYILNDAYKLTVIPVGEHGSRIILEQVTEQGKQA